MHKLHNIYMYIYMYNITCASLNQVMKYQYNNTLNISCYGLESYISNIIVIIIFDLNLDINKAIQMNVYIYLVLGLGYFCLFGCHFTW